VQVKGIDGEGGAGRLTGAHHRMKKEDRQNGLSSFARHGSHPEGGLSGDTKRSSKEK